MQDLPQQASWIGVDLASRPSMSVERVWHPAGSHRAKERRAKRKRERRLLRCLRRAERMQRK